MSALDLIRPLRPSADFAAWLRAGSYPDLQSAWAACPRAAWLLWLAERDRCFDRVSAVRAAAAIARDVIPAFESEFPDDSRPRRAIEAAEAWCDDPTQERTAARVARARASAARAADAARATAVASKSVDDAAWTAVWAADACAGTCASVGAGVGVWFTAAVAARAAVRTGHDAADRRHADIVRRFLPSPPKIQ